jgi:hypothetical protein
MTAMAIDALQVETSAAIKFNVDSNGVQSNT